MSESKKAKCPYCHKELRGSYRVDLHEMRTTTYCPHCHESCVVIYGNGKIKAERK